MSPQRRNCLTRTAESNKINVSIFKMLVCYIRYLNAIEQIISDFKFGCYNQDSIKKMFASLFSGSLITV